MPLDLTDAATKAEFEALLAAQLEAKLAEQAKAKGYDEHAGKVIERLNAEAKASRERAEKAEAAKAEAEKLAAKALDDAKAEAEAKAKEEAEKAKKGATTDEQLAKIEESFKAQLEQIEKNHASERKRVEQELAQRDRALVTEAVRAEARARGIIDDALVDRVFDLDKIKVEAGQIDREGVVALVEEMQASKPVYFAKKTEMERDESGQFIRKSPAKNGAVDAAKLDPAAFDALTEKLRRGRV